MTTTEKQVVQHVINGVEIEILNYKNDYVGIRYAKANGYYFLADKLHITYEGGSTGKSLESCRLLLIPLKTLKLEHAKNCMYTRLKTFINDIENYRISAVFWDDLLNNHYDVNNLISKHAIDIKTKEDESS